ncbi:hypothetical protein TPHA_0H01370 [Tetrapisispora phaffii CBS 4417]|uniref:ribonuclease Z n=1 Tax=Tetrapisispora phaffii (strain ATCC 24235 / CBS 4417 / NBRC 1672 / NRRL Y-8282 / UCD 70-5) TaxID=1071381 RepID=G8BX39_TETPH|nr:hypothetical protein TPHA_0H01370 [Tetrapisispora phaffii CBS 4417]CCE64343.1 hypothetical protein TPHA_0H01370 [Tetrapisispora phaffii CBS 4417]
MFNLSTISYPTSDTAHPLLLLQSIHGEKYFFGKISEGSQRCLTEKRIRVSKLENLFLTGELNWSSIGGLPGMILTIADQGRDKLNLVYGDPIINYIVSSWRYFVFRFGINLRTTVLKNDEIFKDNLLTVKSIVIGRKFYMDREKSLFNSVSNITLNSIVSNMFPKHAPTEKYDPTSDPHLNVELPKDINIKDIASTTSYEINFNPIRGKFKVDEALKLGVPKGPLFAKLTKGETITLENGSIITPDKVLEKERVFSKILVLDIPNDEYFSNFISHFQHNYNSTNLGSVYYFLGDDVTISNELIQLMESFPEETQHFISHSKVSPNNIVFSGAASTILKLKSLQIENYNLPRTDRVFSKEFYDLFKDKTDLLPSGSTLSQHQELPLTSTKLLSKNIHVFSDRNGLDIIPYTNSDNINDSIAGTEKVKILEQHQSSFSWDLIYHNSLANKDVEVYSKTKVITDQLNINNFNNTFEKKKGVEVITLGTGSALPSKYRNVVSTLVKIPYENINKEFEQRCILLDAGENTLGTIKRMFSSIEINDLFKNLKMIYLSHLHADHHLGIISILNEWYLHNKFDPDSKIYLITPWQYNKFMDEWLRYENPEILDKIRYISGEHLISSPYVRKETLAIKTEEYNDIINGSNMKKRKLELDDNSSFRDLKGIREMYKDLNINRFETCKAIHCNWAYSNSISFFMNHYSKNSFKVSYSGDTRPNFKYFANGIGQGSDLLIHEATLDNELVEDAIQKRHCTINEAIEVSNTMNARKLILTHFSQRYPKLPQMDRNIEIKANEYCFAFDGFIVSYDKIGEQQKIFTILNKLFDDEKQEETAITDTDGEN